MRTRKLTFGLAGALSATLLAGCAVLRIDVDVYKGPLANHRDVQAQQLWSMAIAARPLLTELRDTIEWDKECLAEGSDTSLREKALVEKNYEACLIKQRNRYPWYKDGFVDPDNSKVKEQGGGFQQYQAIRVNEILGLYEPFDPKVENNNGENGEKEKDATKDKTSDASGSVPPLAVTDVPLLALGAGDAVELASAEVQLAAATKPLPSDEAVNRALEERSRWEGLFETMTEWVRRSNVFSDLSSQRYIENLAGEIGRSTNVNILSVLLNEPGLPPDVVNTLRSDFTYYIRGTTKEGPLRDLWPMTDGVGDRPEVANSIEQALARAILDDPIRYMTALRRLDAALRTENGDLSNLVLRTSRLRESRNLIRLVGLTWPGNEVASAISRITITSSRPTENLPTDMSDQGATVHSGVTANQSGNITVGGGVSDIGRKFVEAAQSQRLSNETFVDNLAPPAGGLKGGRLTAGIFDLTKNYLEAKKIYDESCAFPLPEQDRELCANKERSVAGQEKVLTDALARFAEKILTIANNDTLLRSPDDAAEVFSQLGRKQLNRFVVVLQAVGNAILVQVDELRRRAGHEAEIRTAGALAAEVSEITGRFNGECAAAPRQAASDTSGSSITDSGTTEGAPEAAKTKGVETKALADVAGTEANKTADKTKTDGEAAADEDKTKQGAQQSACNGQSPFQVHGLSATAANGANAPSTTMEALDRLITALKHEQVQATLNFPGDASEACKASNYTDDPSKMPAACLRLKQVTDALDLAYQHRSGMVYIRPPGAYLRTSFAATNLQGDPNLGWNNMLLEQSRRSMPYWDVFEKQAGGNQLQIQTQIDKRFWQNINSVRVSGMGQTDYVLVKDDIGNWYVKGLSADPKAVFDAAQSTALFSIGGSIGANLLLQRNLERDLLKSNDATERAALREELKELSKDNRNSVRGGGTELGGVLDTYVDRYVKSSDDVYRATAALVTHGDYQTFITDQNRVLTSAVADSRDQAAMSAAIGGLSTAASVQSVYDDAIAPKLAVPATPPPADLDTAKAQSDNMISAAGGLIGAAGAAEREVSSLQLADAVTHSDGRPATTALPDLEQQKAVEDTRIQTLSRDLASASTRLETLEAVVRDAGASVPAPTQQQHTETKADVARIQGELLQSIGTRDMLAGQIAALKARVAQAQAIKSTLADRLRGYFRGKIELIYASRKALNEQLNSAVSVLSTPSAKASP